MQDAATIAKEDDKHEGLLLRISEAEGECDRLRSELKEAEDARIPLREERIRDLAHVRRALKAGKLDEGRERLERVLGDLDPAWRTLA